MVKKGDGGRLGEGEIWSFCAGKTEKLGLLGLALGVRQGSPLFGGKSACFELQK